MIYNKGMAIKKIIAANWKENPGTAKEAEALFSAVMRAAASVPSVRVVVCPPSVFIGSVGNLMRTQAGRISANFALGAQDVFWEDEGAFTGGVGPKILRGLGVRYAIIGHSERRRFFGETDEMVERKARAAREGGIVPIVCVGEPHEVRRKGIAAAKRFLAVQLRKGLKGIADPDRRGKGKELIVAYEPVWAIGSGNNDRPADAAVIAAFIKTMVPGAKVLYGGSVNEGNVREYTQSDEIDGALVGGASLKADAFKKIIHTI